MSLQPPELDSSASEDKGVFFMEYDWKEEDQMDHHKLILRKADALASENCLKEAIDCFAMAMRHGAVRPEELSVLVDCILRNFTLNAAEPDASHSELGPDKDMFDCPGCHGFLGEPITLACGHSYCTRCLRRAKLSRCKTCREPLRGGELKVNVVLGGLLNACFVEELKRYKAVGEVEELTRRKCYQEAVSLASELINSDVEASPAARLARAEAYTALRQYRLALEDVVFCLDSGRSAEGVFRKATVLQAMGQVDESLQVFLQCLALDEDFTVARRQVEMILCELLSPAGDSLKEGLRETTQGASPRLRSKTPVFGAPAQSAPEQRCQVQSRQQQQQQQQQSRAASVHTWAHIQKTGRSDSLQRSGLSRAHSLCAHTSVSAEEGLKRVCSAPQLGCQDRGGLLKRKLSVSESKRWVRCVGGSKHPKQGELWGAKHRAAAAKASRDVPRLNPNDLECALCMRLFYEPVTTPCGHTFCKNCLERCLDHTPQCPLCKESLKEYLASRKYVVTALLDELIRQQLRVEHAERAKAHLEETRELSDLTKGVPIFVCTMAYPTVPCPLHVFEPRYRLMIRRCMGTGTQQFGMCINDPVKGFVDYGCMLIIRSVHFLPDGRSVVDTVGGKRFRVLSRGMKDGYSVADIEHLEDSRVEDGEELSSLQELHDAVYEQACTWFKTLKVRFHNQIMQHFGPMPEREADIQATPNGPACCWWLLAVLPVDPRYQLSVLSMTSLRQRLLKIQHILTYLQSIPGS